MNLMNTLYSKYLSCSKVCTDTRDIEKRSLFVCLKGAHFDGNQFAEKALEKGAQYVICERPDLIHNPAIINVEDSLITLQNLAKYHRSKFKIPFIGITGTNGKTTTKELVYTVLKSHYKTYATQGNFNNHIGVPLTILSIPQDAEIAIIEMGANHIGEIADLCQIAMPNYGIITNIGKAHLEGFLSEDGIIQTKKALYDTIRENHGTIIINGDDLLLMNLGKDISSIKYGKIEDKNDIFGSILQIEPYLTVKVNQHRIQTHLTGMYNLNNILAAIATGFLFKVPCQKMIQSIENYSPQNQRSQIKETQYNKVICDYYNANPSNVHAALENFIHLNHPNKWVILGDMLELGNYAASEHQNIIQFCQINHLNNSLFVGNQYALLQNSKLKNTDMLIDYLKEHPIRNALILVKGSRGIHLEKIIPYL